MQLDVDKEVYIPINRDNNCVICLENCINNKEYSISHSKLINSECNCKYKIHKSCFDKWLKNRPIEEINCLICSSKAKPILTCNQQCYELTRKMNYNKIIICISKTFIIIVLMIFILFILNILESWNNNYN